MTANLLLAKHLRNVEFRTPKSSGSKSFAEPLKKKSIFPPDYTRCFSSFLTSFWTFCSPFAEKGCLTSYLVLNTLFCASPTQQQPSNSPAADQHVWATGRQRKGIMYKAVCCSLQGADEGEGQWPCRATHIARAPPPFRPSSRWVLPSSASRSSSQHCAYPCATSLKTWPTNPQTPQVLNTGGCQKRWHGEKLAEQNPS